MSEQRQASVLYAEDEDLIGNTMAEILGDYGFDVHRVADGIEALEASFVKRFDLLMTDLDMPRMDGLELVRRMRLDRPDIPVVVLTGNPPGDGIAAFSGFGSGPTALLNKPARISSVVATLRSVAMPAPEPVASVRPGIQLPAAFLPRPAFSFA